MGAVGIARAEAAGRGQSVGFEAEGSEIVLRDTRRTADELATDLRQSDLDERLAEAQLADVRELLDALAGLLEALIAAIHASRHRIATDGQARLELVGDEEDQ